MATQLKPDFRPIPVPAAEAYKGYRPTHPNIRIAFSAGPATLAVRDKLAATPQADSTLDEIAADQPFRGLLERRNALLGELNGGGDWSDERTSAACNTVNGIETAILRSPSRTADDAVVKLIALAQVSAEGHEVEEEEAARVIVDVRRHFGIGYVHASLKPEGSDDAPAAAHGFDLSLMLGKAAAATAAHEAFYRATVTPTETRYYAIRASGADADAIETARKEHDAAHAAVTVLLNADCQASYDVCHFPVSTPADLHAKVGYMVANQMFDGFDWGAELLADAERLAFGAAAAAAPRAAWDAAWQEHEAAITADAPITAQHEAAHASGTMTAALEAEWDGSATRMGNAEWALLGTSAPDLDAVEWKLKMLARHGMTLNEEIGVQLIADMRGICSRGAEQGR